MRLHYLQHVPFEGAGYIERWAQMHNASVSCTRLYTDDPLPALDAFDLLIILGGPMGIHDHRTYPWLSDEKRFIQKAIENDKAVLGICLGAQLIADALDAPVYPAPQREIGWFPIRRSKNAPPILPAALTVFHWHGDTFDIPAGAVPLASSDHCPNQGFVYNERVVALQFHLETTTESMEHLIENCGDEIEEAVDVLSVQSAVQIRAGEQHIVSINAVMGTLLDQLSSRPHCLQ